MAVLILGGSTLGAVFAQDQSSDAGASAPVRLAVDLNAAHNFAGLGTQAWSNTPHPKEQDAACLALHLRFIRFSLIWKIPPDELMAHPHPSVADISALIRRNDSPLIEGHVTQFRNEMKTLGVDLHFVAFQAPKCWLTNQGGPQEWLANSDHIPDSANWLAAQLLQLKAVGIVPSHVEITNEPEGNWDALYTPDQYDAYLVAARKAMDASGLQDIKIAGPGAGTGSKPTASLLAGVISHGDGNLLDILSIHCYDVSITGQDFPNFALFKPMMAKLPPGTQIFVTEYNNKSHSWGKPPYQLLGHGKFPTGRGTADFAVSSVGDALEEIADGANSIFIWEAADQPWGDANYGLIDVHGQPKQVLTATETVFQDLPWNVPAVGATGAPEGVAAVAFKTNAGVRLAIDNMSLQAHALNLSFRGTELPLSAIEEVRLYDSSGATAARGVHPSLSNGALAITVSPRTLIVLTLK